MESPFVVVVPEYTAVLAAVIVYVMLLAVAMLVKAEAVADAKVVATKEVEEAALLI